MKRDLMGIPVSGIEFGVTPTSSPGPSPPSDPMRAGSVGRRHERHIHQLRR